MRPTTHTPAWLAVRVLALAVAAVALSAPVANAMPVREPDGVADGTTTVPAPPQPRPQIVFPFMGAVTQWHDDFGESRPIDREQGNDIGVNPGTPVVAAAAGTLERMWWGGAGWTVRITTASGDQYLYIHLGLNGQPGKAYVPGLHSEHVFQGEHIGFSGYSGNASIDFPHLEFQYLPHGGAPVDPFRLLKAAPHLLFVGPHVVPGARTAPFTLRVQGMLTAVFSNGGVTSLRLNVDHLTPSSGPAGTVDAITLRVPAAAQITRDGTAATLATLVPGDGVDIQSVPLRPTVAQELGFPSSIPAAVIAATSPTF